MSNQSQTSSGSGSDTDKQYGLTGIRDEETGEVDTDEFVFEWDGQEVRLELVPPTLTQQENYEGLGSDVEVEQLREIVERHVVKPEEPPDDWTLREVSCYLEGIMRYSAQGGTDLGQVAREELAQRESPGN